MLVRCAYLFDKCAMRILAIETSCDETSVAVVEDGTSVRSNVIATVEPATTEGGVIPEHVARRQVECMLPVLRQALAEAGASPRDIDAVAVTRGPGLLGSLLVGTTTARVLASLWRKPLIGVHHTLGHLSSPWLEAHPNQKPKTKNEPIFPILTLSASGGHTDLWYRTAHTRGTLLGRTRDDAAGEAFDKGAALLGLPYPGGPAIAKAAEGGDPHAFPCHLPLHGEDTPDFSFSGLKTALKYLLRDLAQKHQEPNPRDQLCRIWDLGFGISDIAAAYQHALCRHLTDRIIKALRRFPEAAEVHVVGGVSANRHLRSLLPDLCGNRVVRFPASLATCTDNAAMIGAAAYFLAEERGEEAFAPFETKASLPLEVVVS